MRVFSVAVSLTLALTACEQKTSPAPVQSTVPFTYAGIPSMVKAPDGADGSGCLADSGPLPDGIWYGYAMAWTSTSLDLDPACVYSGTEAAKQAAKIGEAPPDDFIIVNSSKAVRKIPVMPGTSALRVTHDAAGNIANEKTVYADLIVNSGTYMKCPGDGCPVWVAVNGGVVTEVSMQYVP